MEPRSNRSQPFLIEAGDFAHRLDLARRSRPDGRLMTILASILWRRVDAPGHDACRLEEEDSGWSLHGAAVFRHWAGAASLSYSVRCDRDWKTLWGRVHGAIGERRIDYLVMREEDAWLLNGEEAPGLAHLSDLDLSFTPATNFLQVKRVALPLGETVHSPAAWFDLEAGALTELRQIYQRRGDLALHYQAPDVGYEGLLELTPSGFISNYPGLWAADQER
jgi:uncharacterized protein